MITLRPLTLEDGSIYQGTVRTAEVIEVLTDKKGDKSIMLEFNYCAFIYLYEWFSRRTRLSLIIAREPHYEVMIKGLNMWRGHEYRVYLIVQFSSIKTA